jgi:hypothetical protein
MKKTGQGSERSGSNKTAANTQGKKISLSTYIILLSDHDSCLPEVYLTDNRISTKLYT